MNVFKLMIYGFVRLSAQIQLPFLLSQRILIRLTQHHESIKAATDDCRMNNGDDDDGMINDDDDDKMINEDGEGTVHARTSYRVGDRQFNQANNDLACVREFLNFVAESSLEIFTRISLHHLRRNYIR